MYLMILIHEYVFENIRPEAPERSINLNIYYPCLRLDCTHFCKTADHEIYNSS